MCPKPPLATRFWEVNVLSKRNREDTNKMTVQEAGKMGGQKVRKLIQEGKAHEDE